MMFQEWLGADQAIDLRQWALCLGMRQIYLDSLPNIRGAVHVILLDHPENPCQVLRLAIDNGQIESSVHLCTIKSPHDLDSLALSTASDLPSDPPLLGTILLDHTAATEFLMAAINGRQTAARLPEPAQDGLDRHWSIQAQMPLVEKLARSLLAGEMLHCSDRIASASGQTFIFHRGGMPNTRGGTHFDGTQFSPVSPEELVTTSAAIWIDERLIGEGLITLDRALKHPQQRPFAILVQLATLLKKNYLRYPRDLPLRVLRWLPPQIGALWLKHKLSPPKATAHRPPAPQAGLKLALYLQMGNTAPPCTGTRTAGTGQGHTRQLFSLLERYPEVKATFGWTQASLSDLSPDELARYRAGLERGQFETACAALPCPLPMIADREMLRQHLEKWHSTVQKMFPPGIQGFVFLAPGSAPGWGEITADFGYPYLATQEKTIRHSYPAFDPSCPLQIEGRPAIGFHQNLTDLLRLTPDTAVLATSMQNLASNLQKKALAIAIDTNRLTNLLWFEELLERLRQDGHSFLLMSDWATYPPQGIAEWALDNSGLDEWIGSEQDRQRTSLIDRTWSRWADIRQASRHVPDPPSTVPLSESLASPSQDVVSEASSILSAFQEQTTEILARMGELPVLPEHAAGVLRLFEPRDSARHGILVNVQVPTPVDIPAENLTFVDQGLAIPSQLVRVCNGTAEFEIGIDIKAGETKDLIVLPAFSPATAEELDITTQRLCNPWLAVLLDKQGQITSICHQGQEKLCGPSNTIKGYMLQASSWLRSDRTPAQITVTSRGPLYGSIEIRQHLAGEVELMRSLRLTRSSSLLDCTTEIAFPCPTTFAGKLIVGEFNLAGQEASWQLPLEAGIHAVQAAETPSQVWAARDYVDVRSMTTGSSMTTGMRYQVHRPTTRTYHYSSHPAPGGLRLGLVASAPYSTPNFRSLATHSGLGFPGHTYYGRYTYRYALLPLSPDAETHTQSYNHALLWAFYPKGVR